MLLRLRLIIMKKINLRSDENLFILSDKQVNNLKQGLLILIKHLDEDYEKSGKQSADKALADAMKKMVDKL